MDLTLHETMLLVVLIDETTGWGRVHRELTIDKLTTCCKMSARSVLRARVGLVKAGLVEVVFTGRANQYKVVEPMGGSVKIPKRLKDEGAQPGQWGASEWPGSGSSYKNNPPRNNEAVKKTIPPSNEGECPLPRARHRPRPNGAEEVVADVVRSATESRKRDIHMRTVPAAFRSWRAAHAECGFSAPLGWGYSRERKAGRMNGQAKVLVDAFDEAADLHTFVNWVVYQWRTDVLKHFHWMTDYPAVPSLGVVVRHLEALVVLWRGGGAKVGEEWRGGPHAREIKRLLRHGKSKQARELMARG